MIIPYSKSPFEAEKIIPQNNVCTKVASGCSKIVSVVSSYTRDPRFESSHRQFWIYRQLHWEDVNVEKRVRERGILKNFHKALFSVKRSVGVPIRRSSRDVYAKTERKRLMNRATKLFKAPLLLLLLMIIAVT